MPNRGLKLFRVNQSTRIIVAADVRDARRVLREEFGDCRYTRRARIVQARGPIRAKVVHYDRQIEMDYQTAKAVWGHLRGLVDGE